MWYAAFAWDEKQADAPAMAALLKSHATEAAQVVLATKGRFPMGDGPNDVGLRVESCQTAGPGFAETPHEDGFELVVERMCSRDDGPEAGRGCPQKTPSLVTPLAFARTLPGGRSDYASEPKCCGSRLDETCRFRGVRAGAVIEGRDEQCGSGPVQRSGGDLQKHHRIEPARNREHDSLAARKS